MGLLDILGRVQRTAARLARRAVTFTRFQTTRTAAISIGGAEYVWETQRDERVRDRHRAFDGLTFNWATGSDEGHPGQPYGCRCFAVPILPERSARSFLASLF